MTPGAAALLIFAIIIAPVHSAEVDWLIEYEASTVPSAPWQAKGQPVALIEDGALLLADEMNQAPAYFEAEWSGDLAGKEIVVEARVQVVSMVCRRGSAVSTWPQRDGAPICVEICDGERVEGLLLTPPARANPGAAPGYVRTLTDRFAQADTMDDLHTYRLVIRGRDMRIERDDETVIEGCGAFWRPTTEPGRQFIRFGSTSRPFTGTARWQFVRLGLREATDPPPKPSPLKITVGDPWPLNVKAKHRETRPYLYDMGGGLLLMSNAQGEDALREPYGVCRSTDEGKTWTVIPDLDQNVFSPVSMVRLADGRIFGMSRWTDLQEDGTLTGKSTLMDAEARSVEQYESRITMPETFRPTRNSEVVIAERHIWQEADGTLTAVVWSRLHTLRLPDGRGFPERQTHLLRSTDLGRTWTYGAHVGLGGEPAVVRLSDEEWLCIARPDSHMSNLVQHRSLDRGKTWTQERVLEIGSVAPDLVLMQSGVLVCSYGRPVSSLMFSLDGGRTWRDHTVVADGAGFNYTAIREIAPGRLLFMDDAPVSGIPSRIYTCYVVVERRRH